MSDDDQEDTTVQIIRGSDGEPAFATVPHREFEELLTKSRRVTGLDAAVNAIRGEVNRLALIPSEVVHRISEGEHPVRVWRLHRGLKAVELAREAGISPGGLSEIETTKKDVSFETMVRIAKTLEVKLDDLMPAIDEGMIEEHRREVQLRDIARRISEIDSMINGSAGFDSGAVRDAAEHLISEATSFMADRAGRFDWLEGIVDKARKTIEEINSTEKSIVETVTGTQKRLSEVFSDSLARAGLFPREMLSETKKSEINGGNRPEAAASAEAGEDADLGDADDEDEDGERSRGWFLR
ncbi:MAG: helix-turn-helix transcriptional regulator [Rhizobiales bacterium]|nr:helix-turn-helix transcriptional regulator [Hyphomicrobiales bacterium]